MVGEGAFEEKTEMKDCPFYTIFISRVKSEDLFLKGPLCLAFEQMESVPDWFSEYSTRNSSDLCVSFPHSPRTGEG